MSVTCEVYDRIVCPCARVYVGMQARDDMRAGRGNQPPQGPETPRSHTPMGSAGAAATAFDASLSMSAPKRRHLQSCFIGVGTNTPAQRESRPHPRKLSDFAINHAIAMKGPAGVRASNAGCMAPTPKANIFATALKLSTLRQHADGKPACRRRQHPVRLTNSSMHTCPSPSEDRSISLRESALPGVLARFAKLASRPKSSMP